jgi:hypothetical protein
VVTANDRTWKIIYDHEWNLLETVNLDQWMNPMSGDSCVPRLFTWSKVASLRLCRRMLGQVHLLSEPSPSKNKVYVVKRLNGVLQVFPSSEVEPIWQSNPY